MCRSRKRQIEIKAALAQARKSEEVQFAKAWQDRLKELKAEEVSSSSQADFVKSAHLRNIISTIPSEGCVSLPYKH